MRYVDNRVNNYTRHNVMVISAGPNEIFETSLDDRTYDETVGGDDIAYIIRTSIPN